jgi:hypothetical protein
MFCKIGFILYLQSLQRTDFQNSNVKTTQTHPQATHQMVTQKHMNNDGGVAKIHIYSRLEIIKTGSKNLMPRVEFV